MRIILARHGRPDLPVGAWIAPRQMREWIVHYDQADLTGDEAPAATLAAAADAALIVSSPLRRCRQSAQRLAPQRAVLSEEIFREADMPYPAWRYPRLPLAVFGVCFRLAWFCGFSRHAETLAEAQARAGAAAQRLIGLAEEHGSVFLMGHGVMTLLIARQLQAQGWTGPKRPANRHWQFSIYGAPA